MGLRLIPVGKDAELGKFKPSALTIQQISRRMVSDMAIATGVMPLPEDFIQQERDKGEEVKDGETMPLLAIAFVTINGEAREFLMGSEDVYNLVDQAIKWLAEVNDLDYEGTKAEVEANESRKHNGWR